MRMEQCKLSCGERMKVRVIPGTQLLPWMLRHSVWTVVRYQSDQRTKQTPYERTRGCRYESALVPLGDVVMAKIADADKNESRQVGQCLGQGGLGRPCGQIE